MNYGDENAQIPAAPNSSPAKGFHSGLNAGLSGAALFTMTNLIARVQQEKNHSGKRLLVLINF